MPALLPKPLPGEVWSVDFGYRGKVRSAVVVSVPQPEGRVAVITVVLVTTQFGSTPFEVTLPRVPWLREQSYCNAQSVQPVERHEFLRKMGQFNAQVLKDIRSTLQKWLGT